MKHDFSIGNLLRDYINKLIDEDYDFSLPSSRRQALKEFCQLHQEKGFQIEKIRTYFRKKLTECLKNKGIDPHTTGSGKRKSLTFSSDMEAEIIPEPQYPETRSQIPTLSITNESNAESSDKQNPIVIQPKPILEYR